MGNRPESAQAGVQSVDRALRILGMLAQHEALGVTEVASSLGVHKSTAFRLMATLESHDLVEQRSDRGKYRLSGGVRRLAGATAVRLDLVEESRPVTRALAAKVGETVTVMVRAGHEALYVDQVSGQAGKQRRSWVGQRIPLHATSNGKVLLAHAPGPFVDEVLARGLAPITPATVTEAHKLRAELERVRDQGYAVAVDELERGLTAIAAPVRVVDGSVAASVSVSGPSRRVPASGLGEVGDRVRTAAADISARLGWHGVVLATTPGLGEA